LNRTLYRYLETLHKCLVLFLKALALYVVCLCVWAELIYFGLNWFLRWWYKNLPVSWERDPNVSFALGIYPPLIPVGIWLLFVAVRVWRRSNKWESRRDASI
jgi:hypothetical protein